MVGTMTTQFIGPHPWPVISRKLYARGPRVAAIAFLGADGPDLLRHLRDGDTLVVNASKEAVASHSTSPHAIETLIGRGVEVLSSPKLHAKVMVTAEIAVIGSANASGNSAQSLEAVVVTDDPTMVEDARDFVIDVAANANTIDDELLAELHQVWIDHPRAPVPGVNGGSAEWGLLPDRVAGVWLVPVIEDDLEDSEREAMAGEVEQTPEYPIFGFQLGDDSDGYEVGSVLLRYEDGYIHEPTVVFGDVRSPIPGRADGAYQLLRYKHRQRGRRTTRVASDLSADVADEFDGAIAADDDVVLSDELAEQVLRVWGLVVRERD